MSKVVAIVKEDLAKGFALTGLEVLTVADAAGAEEALAMAGESAEYGMIVIEDELLAGLEPHRRAALEAGTSPLVVSVPGTLRWTSGEEAAEDETISSLIRRAVGYRLNIRL